TFFLSSPYSWALVVMEKQKRLPVFYGLGLIFNVVANLILIPQYGYMACAYITILTEFIVLILVYREVRISNLLQN
ncbi:polysaccharide biosynthesis C-terminal domain-containing protein, partial [Patescibacteria group bacterium]|nr:polysaccharide biosynthesis C-terminal domain-containing protein [Patescibacteria group bacterium]